MTAIDFGDGRRAAAYLAHVCTGDAFGVHQVIDEAKQSGRLVELLRVVAAFLPNAAPSMVGNPTVVAEMRARITKYTEKENNTDE